MLQLLCMYELIVVYSEWRIKSYFNVVFPSSAPYLESISTVAHGCIVEGGQLLSAISEPYVGV